MSSGGRSRGDCGWCGSGTRASRKRLAAATDGLVEEDRSSARPRRSTRSASRCSRHCSRTCSTAAARRAQAEFPAQELVDRFNIPPEQLEEHLSLLNLVNFGGGCYAVYAELDGDTIRVDKELFGDTFRAPPRLTPLEARAIRLALEFVGPMIAADARSPLDRVRDEARGDLRRVRAGADARAACAARRGGPCRHAQPRAPRAAPGRDRLPEGGRGGGLDAPGRAVLARAPAALLVRAHVGPHARRRALVPARPDAQRTRCSAGTSSRARASTRTSSATPARPASGTRPQIARWEFERGARRSTDGSAVAERPVGSPEWLVGEILCYRGEAVVLEPQELRREIASRAQAVQRELGPLARPGYLGGLVEGQFEGEGRALLGRRATSSAPP